VTGPSPWPGESPQPPAQPTAPQPFPPLTGAAIAYNEKTPIYAEWATAGSLVSRYVLYQDGAFELQFETMATFFSYSGRYQESNGAVTLVFANPGAPGSWVATATLQNGELSVKYNNEMVMADFVDGVYDQAP
jgi:hypothetical protein